MKITGCHRLAVAFSALVVLLSAGATTANEAEPKLTRLLSELVKEVA